MLKGLNPNSIDILKWMMYRISHHPNHIDRMYQFEKKRKAAKEKATNRTSS